MNQSEFAKMIGASRRSIAYKEQDEKPWTVNELITISEIMKANEIDSNLTVSKDGMNYSVSIVKED